MRDEPAVGRLADRARVEQDQVGLGALGRLGVAERLEHALHPLGVVLVHLTPEGGHVVALHAESVAASAGRSRRCWLSGGLGLEAAAPWASSTRSPADEQTCCRLAASAASHATHVCSRIARLARRAADARHEAVMRMRSLPQPPAFGVGQRHSALASVRPSAIPGRVMWPRSSATVRSRDARKRRATLGPRRRSSVGPPSDTERHAGGSPRTDGPPPPAGPAPGGSHRRLAQAIGAGGVLVALDRHHEIPGDVQRGVDLGLDLLRDLRVLIEIGLRVAATLAEALVPVGEERA